MILNDYTLKQVGVLSKFFDFKTKSQSLQKLKRSIEFVNFKQKKERGEYAFSFSFHLPFPLSFLF